VAPIEIELPVQIAVLDIRAAAGKAFTVTVTELDFTQPYTLVSITWYSVVAVGETDGFAEVEVNPEGELPHE
jgi:hypothetical protein